MSFDLFAHCYRNGHTSKYPRTIAERIFDRRALRQSNLSYVEYADGRGEIYCQDDDDIDGFMLTHFGGHTICERVLEIATVTNSLLFWPSPNIWMGVTDAAVLRHLPDELKAERHALAILQTVDDLWAAINA